MQKITVIDFQLTGHLPSRDKIVEVALVVYDPVDGKITQRFHKVVNPEKKLSVFFLAMVNFDKKTIDKVPTFKDIAQEINELTQNSILIGFNIRSSYALLRYEMKNAGVKFQRRQIELMTLINQAFPPKHAKTLTTVCRDLNIAFSHTYGLVKRVNALFQIFKKLFLDKQGVLDIGDNIVLQSKKDISQNKIDVETGEGKRIQQLEQAKKANQKKGRRGKTRSSKISKSLLSQAVLQTRLPANLPPQKLEDIPNAVGVYYFLNQKGQNIYLGKSKNIRTRILSHFSSDLASAFKQQFKAQIHDIYYRVTGSELVALLLESDEIKRFMPAFNKAQRRKRYVYAVFFQENPKGDGFNRLYIDYVNPEGKAIQKMTTRWKAINFILHNALRFQVNLELCGISVFEKWFKQSGFEEEHFEPIIDTPETHNAKLQRWVQFFDYLHPNMLIVETGRTDAENALVWIENNRYQGYTYVDKDTIQGIVERQINEGDEVTKTPILLGETQVEHLRQDLIPFRENPDVKRIIQGYIRQHRKDLQILQF